MEDVRIRLDGVDRRLVLYGMLFSLSNRIQTIGDSQYDDITLKQHFLMIVLSMLGDYAPTLVQTAQIAGCSYQNVKRMAAHLEKNGYLHIRTDALDRRKQRLVGTGKFQQMEAQKQAMSEAFMSRLYRDITDDELESAIAVLRKMDFNLGGSYND